MIEQNKIGKIYFFSCTYVNGSVVTNKNKVGALSDIGSHSLNLFEYLIKKKISKFNCLRISHEHKKDDNGFFIARVENILCSIHFSFIRWKNKFNLEISGEKGYIQIKSLLSGKTNLNIRKEYFLQENLLLEKSIFIMINLGSMSGYFLKNL